MFKNMPYLKMGLSCLGVKNTENSNGPKVTPPPHLPLEGLQVYMDEDDEEDNVQSIGPC